MNFLIDNDMKFFEYKASKVWFTSTDIFVELEDGKQASLPIRIFPLLSKASLEERNKFEIIGGYAIHWPALGEDLSVAGFFEQENDDSRHSQSLSVSKR
jgi:hypothetical protein